MILRFLFHVLKLLKRFENSGEHVLIIDIILSEYNHLPQIRAIHPTHKSFDHY